MMINNTGVINNKADEWIVIPEIKFKMNLYYKGF